MVKENTSTSQLSTEKQQLLQDVLTWHLFPVVPKRSLRGHTRASGTCHFLEDNHKADSIITQRPDLSTTAVIRHWSPEEETLGLWVDMVGMGSKESKPHLVRSYQESFASPDVARNISKQ